MKRNRTYLLFAAICFGALAGIVMPRWIWTNEKIKVQAFDLHTLKNYTGIVVDSGYLLLTILQKRFSAMLLLFFSAYTQSGFWVLLLSFLTLGTSFGVLASLAVWQMGFFGILFLMGALFPQWLFYGIAGYRLVVFLEKRRARDAILQERGIPRKDKKVVIEFLALAGFVIVGSIAEAYINPWIIKNIIIFFTG